MFRWRGGHPGRWTGPVSLPENHPRWDEATRAYVAGPWTMAGRDDCITVGGAGGKPTNTFVRPEAHARPRQAGDEANGAAV